MKVTRKFSQLLWAGVLAFCSQTSPSFSSLNDQIPCQDEQGPVFPLSVMFHSMVASFKRDLEPEKLESFLESKEFQELEDLHKIVTTRELTLKDYSFYLQRLRADLDKPGVKEVMGEDLGMQMAIHLDIAKPMFEIRILERQNYPERKTLKTKIGILFQDNLARDFPFDRFENAATVWARDRELRISEAEVSPHQIFLGSAFKATDKSALQGIFPWMVMVKATRAYLQHINETREQPKGDLQEIERSVSSLFDTEIGILTKVQELIKVKAHLVPENAEGEVSEFTVRKDLGLADALIYLESAENCVRTITLRASQAALPKHSVMKDLDQFFQTHFERPFPLLSFTSAIKDWQAFMYNELKEGVDLWTTFFVPLLSKDQDGTSTTMSEFTQDLHAF